MASSSDLTVRAPSAFSGGAGLVIDSPATLWKLAENIAEAGICPYDLRGKPADVFMVMSMGLELGFSATASLSMIYIVKGRPALGYEACLAKIQSHPDCEYVHIRHEGTGDARCAIIETKRKSRAEANEPIRFSIGDARQARLYDEKWRDKNGEPSVWVKYTDDQLVAKAVARSKRRDWPDILPGLQVYEDLREVVEVRNVTPVREASAPPKADPARALLGGSPVAVELPAQQEERVVCEKRDGVDSYYPEPVADEPSGNPGEFKPKTLADLKAAIDARVEFAKGVQGQLFQPGPFRAQLRKKLAALYPDLKDGDHRLLDAIADASSMEVSQ